LRVLYSAVLKALNFGSGSVSGLITTTAQTIASTLKSRFFARASALGGHCEVKPGILIRTSSFQAACLRVRRRLVLVLSAVSRRIRLRTIFFRRETFCGNALNLTRYRDKYLAEQVVTLPAPCKQDALDYEIAATPCEVRLIRHVFGHKVRVLVTSLLDLDAYPTGDFGALYHSRWRIEEAFERIKHRLALEQLSGMSWLAAQQDFGAKILCDNLNALAVHAASESIDPSTSARYFINRGDPFSRIKRTLGRWLLQGLDALDNVASVFNELIKNLVQMKPNRSCPRKFSLVQCGMSQT
jgi:hypothetical protein